MMLVLTCCDIVCNSAAKQSDVMGLVFVFTGIHHDHDGPAPSVPSMWVLGYGGGVKGPTPDTSQVPASSNKGVNRIS